MAQAPRKQVPPQGPGAARRPAWKPRRVPTPPAALAFLLAWAACMGLFAGRSWPSWRLAPLLALDPGAYSHVSNFCIAYLLVAVIGYVWLVQGVSLRLVAAMGAVVAAVNLAYEAWLPLINTRDMVDAAYGVAGVALALLLLALVDRFGMRPAPP